MGLDWINGKNLYGLALYWRVSEKANIDGFSIAASSLFKDLLYKISKSRPNNIIIDNVNVFFWIKNQSQGQSTKYPIQS